MQPANHSWNLSRRTAMQFVVLLGIVSLFGDVTYEGARSITGPYLAVLGASATAVGVTAGLGELMGYGLRLVSGYISDRTRRYWAVTLVGYTVNLLAVPALALAGVLAAKVNDFRSGFATLVIPALLTLTVLLVARYLYPRPRDLDKSFAELDAQGLDRRFWCYLVAVGFIALGYADFNPRRRRVMLSFH